jgi:hypothetical protein
MIQKNGRDRMKKKTFGYQQDQRVNTDLPPFSWIPS